MTDDLSNRVITTLPIHLGTVLGKKLPRGIEKQGKNVDFEHRLPLKQPKSLPSGISRHATEHAQIRMLPDAQSQQAKIRAFYDMLYNRQKPEATFIRIRNTYFYS